MVSEAPPFWWTKPDWRAWLLSPVSFSTVGLPAIAWRMPSAPPVPIPVICVGNFTVGGAGKTPTALTIARAAKAKGLKPGFLSRGYGGTLDVTTVVDPAHHLAGAVGDEPLLLAREALTVISPPQRRGRGAARPRRASTSSSWTTVSRAPASSSTTHSSSSIRFAVSATAISCPEVRSAPPSAVNCATLPRS